MAFTTAPSLSVIFPCSSCFKNARSDQKVMFYNSQLEYFGLKLTSDQTPRAWKHQKTIFMVFYTWFLVMPKFWTISVLHMVSNYYPAHLITISDVHQASIQNIDYSLFCHFEGFFCMFLVSVFASTPVLPWPMRSGKKNGLWRVTLSIGLETLLRTGTCCPPKWFTSWWHCHFWWIPTKLGILVGHI